MNTGNIIALVIGFIVFTAVFVLIFYVFGTDTMNKIKEYAPTSYLSGQGQANVSNPNRMFGGKRRYKKCKK